MNKNVKHNEVKHNKAARTFARSALCYVLCFTFSSFVATPTRAADDLYPKHLNPQVQKAIKRGLDYLAKVQSQDGNYTGSSDASAYPVSMTAMAGMAFLANGNTPSRGPYADNVRMIEQYLLGCQMDNGIITSGSQEQGRPMYGHGFALLFLSEVYGMETDERTRQTLKKVIIDAVNLTARGQSSLGGWTYVPGQGDEGSVTITQLQALRAANNAGFTIPKGTIEGAVKYLERCQCPDGGIMYSYGSGPPSRPAISAAALASMYNAGEYDSVMSDACLAYVWKQFEMDKSNWASNAGFEYYTQLYAAQAFYQAGDKYWDEYFPPTRDKFLKMQQGDGSWGGDIGPVFTTSTACIILQLPYKFLPIYQR